MKGKFYIGIDVGGTKIAAGLVSHTGKIIGRAKVPTPQKAAPQQIQQTIVTVLETIASDKKIHLKRLAGIGIGIPGVVDCQSGRILATPNIKLAGYPLARHLHKKYKIKIKIDNDVNCGLLGERWLGVAKGARHVIGLFPGTGLGGAIIIDGKLYTGARGAAAELGHMIVDANGPQCTCGNRGCLEAIASRWAIERDIKTALKGGKKTKVDDLKEKNLGVIKSKVLKHGLKAKDPLVTGIMTGVATALGQACVSFNHIFNPEMIVFGGGVIEACGNFLLPRIARTSNADPFFAKFGKTKIVASKLGDDAVILGAVALVRSA